MRNTLAIDFGSQHVGIALVDHTGFRPNRVLYAATLEVSAKPLNALVQPRAQTRRIRRTRKTHGRRLRRLAQALGGVAGGDRVVRFCRRRGYSYDPGEDGDESLSFHVPRAEFIKALEMEIGRVIEPASRERVLSICSRHLNAARQRDAELRPARFENRGPTKCNWTDCRHNVPRVGNDFIGRLQQALYVWLKPVFDESSNPQGLRRSVDHWLAELDYLARTYRKIEKLPAEEKKLARKPLDRRRNRIGRNLIDRVRREASEDVAQSFADNWTEHYRKNLVEIVTGRQGGRVRYCREHSRQFVDFFLAGKQIPNSTEISEGDLVSRKQQILFARIWRLVESRLLPLAGGQIDRVVVERVAFDVLAGNFKQRQKLPDSKAAEMYWHGPMYGFANRREMLKAEFQGRCSYCDDRPAADQVEHLLPTSSFALDSYFNIVPACPTCNAKKGARTPMAAGMRITDAAYEAYCDYVAKLNVPHSYHTIKKGLLNLLRRSTGAEHTERMLAMIANNLVTITNTQRGPRPLGRYLATKLASATSRKPDLAFSSGRHTALYRAAILPDYEKSSLREAGDLRNHAVDAILLGCKLPSATALENPRWTIGRRDVQCWFESVREAGPELADGLPSVHSPAFVPNFEQDLGLGYCRIDLSAYNWNQSRKATHGLDPFGVTPDGEPLKRIPAADVLRDLTDSKKRETRISSIAKGDLRAYVQARPDEAAERFVAWLQQSTRAGLSQDTMSSHPADQARRHLLGEFVQTPVAKIVDGDVPIPWTIGVRCLIAGSRNKIDTTRVDDTGRVFQRYQSNPVWRELFVGYCEREGVLDCDRPVLLYVNQIHAVFQVAGGRKIPVDVTADSPLRGRPLGSAGPEKGFLVDWNCALDQLCDELGICQQFRISQGCVIEKTDGTRFQFRNFDKGKPWMRSDSFKHIQRILRSPLRAISAEDNSNVAATDGTTQQRQVDQLDRK